LKQFELEELIEGCKKGKSAYQEQLYKHCFAPMIKVCLRYTRNMDEAAGFYNTAMFKVFTNINQYRNDGEFLGWVRRIVVNTCITVLKQNLKFQYKELTGSQELSQVSQPEIYQQLTSSEILEAVQSLPENMKLVFNLFVLDGYTHEKIAELLGISKGTSKWYLHEARKILKGKIKALYNYETNSNAV
jgi:RNA polymerase sigma-70 factor (ECF subfamily)